MTIEGLYLITDDNRDGQLPARVEAALRGGARVVQYRDKTASAAEQIAMGRKLAALCRESDALLIANDSPEIARECGADGVHLGQGDGSVAAARNLLGADAVIGVSTRTVEQARTAEQEGADYIGLGAMFATGSKDDAVTVGVERLRQVRNATGLPIVAIGGIDRLGAPEVIDAGADAVAVLSAVMHDADPTLAAREIALLFNRRFDAPHGRVLSVAGSDSGGGAGVQADLKTIALLGGYGMSAISALTAQNTRGVHDVLPVAADFVAAQIEAVLDDIGADTVKTGMLYSDELVRIVAGTIARTGLPAVVDPVMVAKGGASLLGDEAVATLRDELLPLAYLLTPNLPEAEALTGRPVRTGAQMEEAAYRLRGLGARNVLLKGGHLEGEAIDLLLCGDRLHRLPAARIATANTHGTGCTYSAAIATGLARGLPLEEAVRRAKDFIHAAIRGARPLGRGHGPVNHWHGAKAVMGDS